MWAEGSFARAFAFEDFGLLYFGLHSPFHHIIAIIEAKQKRLHLSLCMPGILKRELNLVIASGLEEQEESPEP